MSDLPNSKSPRKAHWLNNRNALCIQLKNQGYGLKEIVSAFREVIPHPRSLREKPLRVSEYLKIKDLLEGK
jgi:hypothetical protein